MIYLEHHDGPYHEFQVYDEPAPGEAFFDPTVRACLTREELVQAIHEIDLHSNVVMADECDEDPPAASPCDADGYTPEGYAWLPEPGQRVRVVWRYVADEAPFVGDVITWHPDHDPEEFAGPGESRISERCVSCRCADWSGSRLVRVVPA